MGRIIISENVTLDGVAQDPMGEGGFERGGWFRGLSDSDREAWAELEHEEARRATALLLGRRSDEWFASRWLTRTGSWADRLNSMPKYVVSTTGHEPRWCHATLLGGDPVQEVPKLREALDGDIVVYASIQLARSLLAHDLVDELRLILFPVLLGAGERFVGPTGGPQPLRLTGIRTVGDSLVHLIYQRVRDV